MAEPRKAVLASGLSRERFQIGESRETVLNEICPTAQTRFPHYFKLPVHDPIALLRWRRYVRNRCIRDLEFRAAIWAACKRDFAFFCVTFVWIFEPRPNPRRMPFHMWTSQVSLASWFCEIYGVRDGGVSKTRGIGLSWLVASFLMWKWFTDPGAAIAVLTETEDKLDGKDTNATLGKLQYIYNHLPSWLRLGKNGKPVLYRSFADHTFNNLQTDVTIQGYVSTGTKLRQLRFTWLFADEFAFYPKHSQNEWMTSSAGTCNSRLFGSTWNDFDDMFHQVMYEDETNLLRMFAFWWNDFERWQGAYKMDAGTPILIDKDYTHPADYAWGEPGLLEDGMLRSPWVDYELSRAGVEKLTTLRDLYGMSVCEKTNSFFAGEIRRAVRLTVQEPQREGLVHLNGEKVTIEPSKKSELRLWCGVPEKNLGPYVCFSDLGQGAGLAFSVACWLDKGGQQVAEFGTNHLNETDFAAHVVAISRWLAGDNGDAWVLIDAEATGPFIRPFKAELLRRNYGHIWYSKIQDERAQRKKQRQGELPEFIGTCNRDGGAANFREMARAVLDMEIIIHSERVAQDIKRCGRDDEKGGRPKFTKPTGNQGHGDFVYACAGAWWRLRSTVDLENRDTDDAENELQLSKKPELWTPKSSHWSDTYYNR